MTLARPAPVHDQTGQNLPEKPHSIGDYLIRRLQDYGVRDVFGIPGDTITAIVLGAIVLAWPGLTVAAFALVWGIYALVDGIGELALGATSAGVPGPSRSTRRRG